MIKIFISGIVGASDIRQVQGKYVLNFSVVSNDYYGGKKVSTWINCQKWNPGGLAKFIVKGATVAVMGSHSMYKSKDTGKEYTTCLVESINFYGSRHDVDVTEEVAAKTAATASDDTGWEHLNNFEDHD